MVVALAAAAAAAGGGGGCACRQTLTVSWCFLPDGTMLGLALGLVSVVFLVVAGGQNER